MEKPALEHERRKLRQHLGRQAWYGKAPDTLAEAPLYDHDEPMKTVVLNFTLGIDFQRGARSLADLNEPAKYALSTTINGLAWLSGKKHRPGEVDLSIQRDVTMTLELIPSEPRHGDVDGSTQEIVGMRLWIDIVKSTRRMYCLTPEQLQWMNPELGELPPAASRKRDDFMRKRTAQSKWLLSTALSASLQETHRIAASVKAQRKAHNLHDSREPHSLLQYRFARFENYSTLYFEGFHRYIVYQDKHVRPYDPAGEVFLNPSDDVNFVDLIGLPPQYRPDLFFTKERAMYYKTVQGEADWSYEHCNLASYYHHIDPNQFHAVEDGDEDGRQFPGRPPLMALYSTDNNDRRPLVSEMSQRSYPRSDLVYVLPHNYIFAEVLLQFMPFPFAMGALVPPHPTDGAVNMSPQIEAFDIVPGLEATKKLDDIERNTGRSGNAASVVAAVSSRGSVVVSTTAEPSMERRSVADVLVQQSLARTPQRALTRTGPPPTPSRALNETLQHHRNVLSRPAQNDHARISRELQGILETQTHNVRVFFSRAITAASAMMYTEFGPDDKTVQSSTDVVTPSEVVDRDGGLSESDDITTLAIEINRMLDPKMLDDANASHVVDAVLQKVDFIPAELRRRNAFNEMRAKSQVNYGLLETRQNTERISAGGSPDNKFYPADAAGNALCVRHREERWQLMRQLMCDMLALVETTNNAPSAWIEARNFAKKTLENETPDDSHLIFDCIDGRPYLACRQMFVDHYAAVALSSQQNMSPLERCHMCSFSAHRYAPNRSQPAPNYIMAGASGIGKSFVLRTTGSYAVPGLEQNTTASTTASYNVGRDFDHEIVIYEEMDSALLFSQRNSNDTGATDKINFAKARLTSFVTSTQYFHRNEETNERESRRVLSSCHIVHLGGTNQYLANMDDAMRRRLIIDYVMTVKAQTDGGKSTDTKTLTSFDRSTSEKIVQHMQHQIHWAYMLVETAIRAGVVDDFPMDGAQIQLDAILNEAQRSCRMNDPSPTKQHWILEIARTMAIVQACYMALFSPEIHYEYEYQKTHFATDAPKNRLARWSARMFTDVVFMLAVPTKDHVMAALEMFDFLFASREEQQILGTLGEKLCKFSTQSEWTHRVLPNLSAHGGAGASMRQNQTQHQAQQQKLDEDPNYLAVTGTTVVRICEKLIQEHKTIAEPRPEDVVALLKPLEKTIIKTRGLEFFRDDRGTRGVRHRREGPLEQRPAIINEIDPRSYSKTTQTRQLCISIEFFEELFNVNFEENTNKEIAETLVCAPKTTESAYYDTTRKNNGPALDKGLVECRKREVATHARAPLIKPIVRALSHPVLEKSPYEHPVYLPVPPQVFRYITSYMPDDVHVDCGGGVGVVRVPLHGTCLLLELSRKTTSNPLRYSNYTKPLPTALRSVPELGREPSRLMRGLVADTYDIDFYTAVQHMDMYGFPGLPGLTRAYLDACRLQVLEAGHAWDAVLKTIPALKELCDTPTGGLSPLPFMFPPIMYRIKRYLYDQKYKKSLDPEYMARNIMTRIQDSVARNVLTTNDAKGYESYDNVVGVGASRYRRVYDATMHQSDDDDEDAGIDALLERAAIIRTPPKKRARIERDENNEDAMDIY